MIPQLINASARLSSSHALISLDLETTGTNPTIHRVIEFGAIKYTISPETVNNDNNHEIPVFYDSEIENSVDMSSDAIEIMKKVRSLQPHFNNGYIEDATEFLVNPEDDQEISPEIVKITGITNELIESEPPFSVYLQSIMDFCLAPAMPGSFGFDVFDEDKNQDLYRIPLFTLPTIIGHNIHFDLRFLAAEIARDNDMLLIPTELPNSLVAYPHPIDLKSYKNNSFPTTATTVVDPFQLPPNPSLCTLNLSRRLMPNMDKYSLEILVNQLNLLDTSKGPLFGPEYDKQHHRALYDSSCAILLFERLYSILQKQLSLQYVPLGVFFLIQETPIREVGKLISGLTDISKKGFLG